MKILAFTSIRSDYDLLSPLYKLLHKDTGIDLKLLVSGAHLSKEFGYTKKYIEQDGYDILCEIETLIASSSIKARIKTASILLQNAIDVVSNYQPDLILYAGDREDVMMAALIGIYLNIPTIHFYGGDHETDGHQDTYIRHAVSKLSSVHFVSTHQHKKRLEALGEDTKNIYNIGSISLDKFKDFKNQDFRTFFKRNDIEKFAVLIYHPVDGEDVKKTFLNILKVLKEKEIFTFVSYPNTDPNYEIIVDIIQSFKGDSNFIFYKNLQRDMFLSIFSQASFIIGNSSAGIYESATLKIPTINVGLRQKDREASKNVVFCKAKRKNIDKAIKKVLSQKFQKKLQRVKNIYGNGKSAQKAYRLIMTHNFRKKIPKTYDPLLKT